MELGAPAWNYTKIQMRTQNPKVSKSKNIRIQIYYKLQIGADQIKQDQITRIFELGDLAWNFIEIQLKTQNPKVA